MTTQLIHYPTKQIKLPILEVIFHKENEPIELHNYNKTVMQ